MPFPALTYPQAAALQVEKWFFRGTAIWQPAANLPFKPLNTFAVEAITGGGSLDFAFDQPGLAQNFEVLADGGLRQWQMTDDVICNAHLVFSQEFNNLKSDRIPQGFEHFC